MPHRLPPCAEVSLVVLKDWVAQLWPLQQVAEGQHRGLILNPVADQVDASKGMHGWPLDQRLFHRRITLRVQLLQQVDTQHRRQWIRRASTLLAGLGVVGLDQAEQCLPRHHHLHLRQGLLPLGQLLGGRVLGLG